MPRPGTQATSSEAHLPEAEPGDCTDPEACTGPEGRDGTEDRDDPASFAGPASGDCFAQRLTLPGRADQVPRARAFIARTLAARGLGEETASLLGSELVTNSVQHSDSRLPGGTVTVAVTVTPADILVEVTDAGGPGIPVLRNGADPCAENGRGMLLVAMLSARWGYQRAGAGLTTWFKIAAEPAARAFAPPPRLG